jgi:hypothetical protein
MSGDLPRAQLAHRIPHRLRVQVLPRKGDRGYFEMAASRLGGHPSIRAARASPKTASITIEHDGSTQDVARLARELEIFELSEAAVVQMGAERMMDRVVGMEPISAVSVGLAGLGIYQAVRGRLLGSGFEHIWHAYGAARTTGSFKIAAVMALLGAFQISRGRILNPAASLFFYALMVRAMRTRR